MGITSTKKATAPVVIMPPRPEYKFMSKAQIVEAQKKDREIALKTREFAEGLRIESPKVEAPKAEAPVVEKKKAGRPRKIE